MTGKHEGVTVNTARCLFCGEEGQVILTSDQFARFQSWQNQRYLGSPGQFIQDALPDVDAATREQLMTGSHGACFDDAFDWGDDEDDEPERCWSHGDELHDYGQCAKLLGHDDEHEDEEGHSW